MKPKPSRESVRKLIASMQSGTRSRLPKRTEFAVTAILAQVNEGIDPFVTAELCYSAFNFSQRWVEFVGFNGFKAVRRVLSDETAQHLQQLMRMRGAKAGDPICTYRPRVCAGQVPAETPAYSQVIKQEVRLAGFDPSAFDPKLLKWIFLDEHPNIRDEERRARMIAQFILDWASEHQKEALLARAFERLPILRPSWAYPEWHKDAVSGPAPNEGAALPDSGRGRNGVDGAETADPRPGGAVPVAAP